MLSISTRNTPSVDGKIATDRQPAAAVGTLFYSLIALTFKSLDLFLDLFILLLLLATSMPFCTGLNNKLGGEDNTQMDSKRSGRKSK